MKASTTLFCDVREYRVFTLYTRDEHNVTCQFPLGQNKHIINKRQVRGAGGESLQHRVEPRGPRPASRLMLSGPGAQRPGWTVAPPRGSVNFRTPPPTVMHGSTCRRSSLQSSSWPLRPARLSRVSVPTSPHRATRPRSRVYPHVPGAPRPSKASPARPWPPAQMLIGGALLSLRPLSAPSALPGFVGLSPLFSLCCCGFPRLFAH